MSGRLVFFTGTGTGVGKTWWTAAVARALRADGVRVAARKPVQSCSVGETTDSEILAAATGDAYDAVCPAHRTYRLAWAPPMAAAELGEPPYTIADLARETTFPREITVGLVEGVGGPRSPIASDGDNVDLVRALDPDLVVLVADAGLGTINAVRLSMAAIAGFPTVVALNRYGSDELHDHNRAFLIAEGLTIVTAPTDLAARLAT